MTIEAFYAEMGVDSAGIILRLATEERVKKYLGKLLNDQTFADLTEAISRSAYEQAFLAVHTLKGVAANLDLTPLYQACSNLTEALRDQKQPDEAEVLALYSQVRTAYESIIARIPALLS